MAHTGSEWAHDFTVALAMSKKSDLQKGLREGLRRGCGGVCKRICRVAGGIAEGLRGVVGELWRGCGMVWQDHTMLCFVPYREKPIFTPC